MLLTGFQVASEHNQEAGEQVFRYAALSHVYLLLKPLYNIHTYIHTYIIMYHIRPIEGPALALSLEEELPAAQILLVLPPRLLFQPGQTCAYKY